MVVTRFDPVYLGVGAVAILVGVLHYRLSQRAAWAGAIVPVLCAGLTGWLLATGRIPGFVELVALILGFAALAAKRVGDHLVAVALFGLDARVAPHAAGRGLGDDLAVAAKLAGAGGAGPRKDRRAVKVRHHDLQRGDGRNAGGCRIV